MEFLIGRSLTNNLFNLQLHNRYTEALRELGYEMEAVQETERDAALGRVLNVISFYIAKSCIIYKCLLPCNT